MTTFTPDIIRTIAYDNPDGNSHHINSYDQRRPLVDAVTTEDLEPLRPLVERFIAEDSTPGIDHADHLIGSPQSLPYTLPRFCWWLVTNDLLGAVPSGDTVTAPDVRSIEYWNSLVRTAQWAPFEDDLVAFMPLSSDYAGWDRDTVRCILGLPFGSRTTGTSGWLSDTEDAAPGNHHRHPYLDEFARAVVDGTYTLRSTTTEEAPITEPTDPTIAAFVTAYGLMPDQDPLGSTGHGIVGPGYDRHYDSVQTAYLAMPEAVRETWRELYDRGLDERGFNSAGVPFDAPEGRYDHGALRSAYGFSTENFFRYARRLGVTSTDGTPCVPSGDIVTAPAEFPFDLAYEEIATRRYEILTAYQDRFFAWADEHGVGQRGAPARSWQRAMTGEYRGDSFWNDRDWSGDRHFRAFVDYAREHRADFGERVPTPTDTTPETTTTDTVTAAEGRVIPIGPEHPGWQAFAERLAATATEAGMCPEYDRIARAVGLPTRKQRVTYRVVLDVQVDVERDHNADVRQLRDAAAALLTSTELRPRALEQGRTQIVG